MKQSNECPVCRKAMQPVIELPRLPLTEKYEPWAEDFEHGRAFYDQALLFCEPCSHGKLGTIIPPEALYGEGYRTRSGASIGSRRAIHNFAAFIMQTMQTRQIDTVIDIGGNDSMLVDILPAKLRAIVDPNASGNAELHRCYIEQADLSPYRKHAKLIVSSHTLEHIEKPEAFFEKIIPVFSYGDLLALQFPSLEMLAQDARIEQVHHQHIHYYSERSITALLARYGFEVMKTHFDADHYGALMVLAQKGGGEVNGKQMAAEHLAYAYSTFRGQMRTAANLLGSREFVIFGAALMLPLFKYHLPALDRAEYIADNDPSKDGLRYINFNKRIRKDYDLAGRDVIIGAMNTKLAARELIKQAFDKGARNVITPLQIL